AQPAHVHLHARRVRADRHRHLRHRRHGDGLRAGRHGRAHAVRVAARAGAGRRAPGAGRGADAAGGGGAGGVLVALVGAGRGQVGRGGGGVHGGGRLPGARGAPAAPGRAIVNLLAARVVLRPRSLADVLDLAVPFCLANRRPLGVLSLLVLGPIAVLAGYMRLRAHADWNLVWLAVAGAAFLVEGIFTVAVGELMFREAREVRVRAVLGRFARRLPAYLLMSIVRDVVMAASAFLLVPPFFL